jgi:hypothetical protein
VRRLCAHLGALGALIALAGCGLGAGATPHAVQLLVTRDFGAHVLEQARAPKLHGQETVMSLLLRNYPVKTRYGGGFVQSIDGLEGAQEAGRPVDWFYYVNGVEAGQGAAATNVHPGDRIWWDRHDWSQTEDVPAVVGSFPEPFLNGIDGKRLPVRVECSSVGSYACRTATARLRALGVPAAIAALGSGGAPDTLRLLVGPWQLISRDQIAGSIGQGPRASGVYVRFTAGGRAMSLLNQDGRTARTLTTGAGLIAATEREKEAPVWAITGTDSAGVDAAARKFDGVTLDERFAVAVSGSEALPLPLGGG